MRRFAVVAALLASTAGFAEDQDAVRRDLEETRRAIVRLAERIRRLTREQSSVSREIQMREAERQLAQSRLQEAGVARDEAYRRHVEAEARAKEALQRLAVARRALARQARAASRVGEPSLLRVALLSESASELDFTWQAVRFLVRQSARAARRFDEIARESQKLQRELLARAEEARRASAEAETRRIEAESARDRAKALLSSILAEREQQERLLGEEIESARRLQDLLGGLGAGALPPLEGKSILIEKGYLPWPAEGPIQRTFGRHKHPRFHTYTISNGIGIAAPLGAPVHSIHDGRVVFADWFTGYGNLVIVDHGDKVYSLYAHLDGVAVEVGDAVTRGQIIARVSDSGSVSGAGLYFEIRRGAQAVNPMEWIGRGRGVR